jgi:hypothetical protein
MTARRVAAGLAAALLVPSSARAEAPAKSLEEVPVVSADFGGSIVQPSLANTMFSSVDAWNGQHTLYQSPGSTLGLGHPIGATFDMTLHVFPFPFRSIGFMSTFQIGTFTGNTTTGTSAFGPVDTTNATYWSWVGGPEGQLRVKDFVMRAGVMGGGRYTNVGDFSAIEWHVMTRGEVDWVVGGERHNEGAFTLGVYGSADIVPSLGWGLGAAMSFAFL